MNIDHKTLVIGTLSQDAFVMVNKKIAHKAGFLEAGFLGELISIYKFVAKEKMFYKDGEEGEWFYFTKPDAFKKLAFTVRNYDKAAKKLAALGVAKVKLMGLPAKNYFLLNWEKITEMLYQNDDEAAPLSDHTKRTNKEQQNVSTRSDETCELDQTKRDYIHNNKKDIQKRDIKTNIKKIDDDDQPHEENFQINNFVFKEFVKEFEEHMPNYYDNEMYNRIYQQMIKQKVSIITFAEAVEQTRYMAQRKESGEIYGDYAAYFVGGIVKKRKSLVSALAAEKFRKAGIAEEQPEKANNIEEFPFYNWLDS